MLTVVCLQFSVSQSRQPTANKKPKAECYPHSVLSGWLSLRGHEFAEGFEPGIEAVE
jgi:hypothetical protein